MLVPGITPTQADPIARVESVRRFTLMSHSRPLALHTPHRPHTPHDPVAALAERDAQLAAIVASSEDAIISKSLDGTILTWNAAAQRLLGWTAEEAIGRPITMIVPHELFDEEKEIVRRLTAGEHISHFRTVRVRKDGRRVDVSLSVSPIRNAAGTVATAAKILRDVTAERIAQAERERFLATERAARIAAEEAREVMEEQATELEAQAAELEETVEELRATNEALERAQRDAEHAMEMLHGFFNAPGVLMLVIGVERGADGMPEHRILLANAEAAALFGGRPETVSGSTVRSLGIPDDAIRDLDAILARVRAARAPVTYETASRRRPGRWLRVSVSRIGDIADGTERFAQLVFDVTEEHESAEQRRRLQLVVENTTDYIGIANPLLQIEYVNPAGLALVGAPSVGALRGTPVLDQFHESARWAIETEVGPAVERDGRWSGESALCDRVTGAAIPVEMTVSAVPDPATGTTLSFACICRPIAERRRMQAALLQAQKMEAVGQLAGGIAHDFNNLLTVISTSVEFLLADTPAGEAPDPDVVAIAEAAARSAALTRQLLAFSRHQVVQPCAFDLGELATRADGLLRRLVSEEIAMTLTLAPDVPWAYADPGQIEQALVNLVVNARDAMPNGGRLTIATSVSERFATLSVSDTGTGMDSATVARLFEPFFTTKPPGKGTGLGLSTVRTIIDQAGGHVAVSTTPGEGSTFTLYLPTAPSSGSSALIEPDQPPAGTETVLLVDDDAMVRSTARRALRRLGYHVLEAGNRDEAVSIARAHTATIDLLLTDVVLPGIGGRDLADEVCALRPGIVVVFMSGYTDDVVLRRRIRAGDPFLEKPFTITTLGQRIRQALDARSAR